MISFFVILISLIFLIFASYFDLRTGEIPEKVSRSYIFTIFFLAFIYSIFTLDYKPIFYSFIMGFIYFLFGYLTYHFGQWGGGDVKILSGIGISLGFLYSLNFKFQNSSTLPYYISYFVDMGVVMIPYLFIYGIFLGIKDRRVFKEFTKILRNKKLIFAFAFSFLPFFIALYFNLSKISLLYLSLPFFLLLSIYMKVIEDVALTEVILVEHLREGDVIADEIFIGGKKISPRDINGLEQEDVEKIKKLSAEGKFPREIKIKHGIKSVPILTLAFLFLVLYGNFLELFLIL
ncbi:MAG: prepilin peptidase [Candidatus Altiarchaeota archaeon]